MVLVELIGPLDKGEPTQESPQPVHADGMVIAAGLSLEGAHGEEGIALGTIPAEQLVKGDTGPGFAGQAAGQGAVEGIGMGQAAVADLSQALGAGLVTPLADAAQKEGLPALFFVQGPAGLLQPSVESMVPENDIVFKDQDPPGPCCQPLLEAVLVGLKDTLFRVFRMFRDEDKLHPLCQPHSGKLSTGLLPSVPAVLQRDAVDSVEKSPDRCPVSWGRTGERGSDSCCL